jgi:sigma-E factor negative regulatory protein RseB
MTGVRRRGLLVLAILALSADLQAESADVDPLQLLDRMNEAVRVLDYEGRFVVQSGEHLDALYVVHRAGEGTETERLVSLTGEPREIIRSDQAVACLVPGRTKPINVGRRLHGRSFSPLRGVDAQQLSRHYQFRLLPQDRVAGRNAHQVEVDPKDDLRFGYRVFIDQATGLPLRSIMLDKGRQPVTQMMFVDLKVGEGVTPIEHDLSALQVARADPADWSPLERLAPAAWEFAELPPGFQLNLHRRRALGQAAAELEHFIFSDGLATVSVYVLPGEGHAGVVGDGAGGDPNTIARVLGAHEVIAVGEVPRRTLEWFAQSVRALP